MTTALLDCGPIVALLDRRDPHHKLTADRSGGMRVRIMTTGPVITEAMFHLQDVLDGPDRLVRFLANIRAEVVDVFNAASLQAASELMAKYHDTPMDFADASLVIAAGQYGIGDILTLDERGFRTFRYGRNKAFRLVLQQT